MPQPSDIQQNESSAFVEAQSSSVPKERLDGRFFVKKRSRLYVIPTKILHALTRIPVKLLFKLIYGLKIEGVENLKGLKPGVIFAANHISELDPILMTLIFPVLSPLLPLFFTSREKSFYTASGWRKIIYGGKFFEAWGAYQVYAGLQNYEKSLRNHIQILSDGHSVCIYPEGQRSRDGKMGEAKGGVGYLTLRTRCPVVPVAINGITHRASFKDYILRRKRIVIEIGKPISPCELFDDLNNVSLVKEKDDCKAAAVKIMSKIEVMVVQNKIDDIPTSDQKVKA